MTPPSTPSPTPSPQNEAFEALLDTLQRQEGDAPSLLEAFLATCPRADQAPDTRRGWLAQLRWLVLQAHALSPHDYQARWRPMLERHHQLWELSSLHTVGSPEALAPWVERAPFALFRVSVLNEEELLRDLAASPHLPWIRELEITSAVPQPDSLMISLLGGEFPQLRSLSMHSPPSPAVLQAIAQSPHLARLEVLGTSLTQAGDLQVLAQSSTLGELRDLSVLNPTAADVVALNQSPVFQKLHTLSIHPIKADIAQAMAEAQAPPSLRELKLRCGDPGDTEALSAWLSAPGLEKLERLTLHAYSTGGEYLGVRADLPSLTWLSVSTRYQALPEALLLAGTPKLRSLHLISHAKASAASLAGCAHLAGLEQLDLTASRLGIAGIARLLKSPHLGQLQRLNLEMANTSRKASTDPLAKLSSFPPRLRALCLSRNQLHPDKLGGLLACGGLQQLTELDLSDNELGPEGARMLAACELLGGLTALNLSHTGLQAQGALALAGSKHLGQLHTLALTGCRVQDGGLEALLKSPLCAGLKSLVLFNNDLTDKAAIALARCEQLAGLEVLDLRRNAITDEGLQALAQSPHLAGLRSLHLWPNRFAWRGAGTDALFQSQTLPWPVRLQWARWD